MKTLLLLRIYLLINVGAHAIIFSALKLVKTIIFLRTGLGNIGNFIIIIIISKAETHIIHRNDIQYLFYGNHYNHWFFINCY